MNNVFTIYWQLFIFINVIGCAPTGKSNDDIIFNENHPWNGTEYSFRFKTQNGTFRSEIGKLKSSDNGTLFIEIQGVYVYPDDNGDITNVIYKANGNGYKSYTYPTQKASWLSVFFEDGSEVKSKDSLDKFHATDLSQTTSPDEEYTLSDRIGADLAASLLG